MKKKGYAIFLLMMCISFMGFTQCFEKKDRIVSLGVQLGAYASKFETELLGTENTGGSACRIIPLSFEYALTNRIGAGITVAFNKFYTQIDSITNKKPKANTTDFRLLGNFHFLRNRRVDMYVGIMLGASAGSYELKNVINSVYKGSGGVANLKLGTRFYAGSRFSFLLDICSANYQYVGRVTDDIGNNFEGILTLRGINFGTGVAYRF
jgi:hypothetical protein